LTSPRLTRLSRSIGGRPTVITGAGSGMGRATAHLFADEGARVAVTDISEERVRDVVLEIRGAGGQAEGFALDVADALQVREVVADVARRFGGIGILVNNAGVSRFSPIDHEHYEDAWDLTLRVNLEGELRMIRACLPHLLEDGAARIVNIASTEGVGATAMGSPYTVSKHGVIGLTRSLAVELGAKGVTVNCVCPGPIRTGMTEPIPEDAKAKFARRRVPLGRYGEPEEVAHATLSLALPAASYINGAVLVVDGGMTVRNA